MKKSDVLDTLGEASHGDIINGLRRWMMTSPIHMVEAVLTVQLPDVLVMICLSDVSLWMILMSTLVHMVMVQLYRTCEEVHQREHLWDEVPSCTSTP